MLEAPAEIIELVDKFERNLEAYKNPNYKEEQLKQEFINPFFKALGWDVDNTAGAAPQYRDVIFEDSIKVGGGTKAPDYCFTLAGRRMFFVEAKKPSVNLKNDLKPAYQLRRYAWSAKLPLSILTDFEEFVIYESSLPKKNDRAGTGRILYLTYKDYVDKWDEIYKVFSKEAVLKGAFDQYAEGTKQKHGTDEIDNVFLKEIEGWRELFAKNIALRNKELSVEELNYAVQQIIDRIIFLRMAEDRGIEKYGKLQALLDQKDLSARFTEICKEADEKYNSGLFHFKKENRRSTAPDELTPTIKIDDGIFKTIIKGLYYPDSPYEFSVLSPEILGNVYEQFLGKVIRLTKSHMAKVEEKPEVKKAGGVYYTRQFVVDYIVKKTVGKFCKGKTPNKISEMKILDPSCGSGSFLLGAYNYLLRWHLNYYSKQKDTNRLNDKIYNGKDGGLYLTIQEKKRILLNNIFGVDIDHQAVEVTKLSLLLKVLEGENKDALESQQKLFKERALPDLENNIKCGNSLIGPDIYDNVDLKLNNKNITHMNPFDWKNEFSSASFDVVIGNPPYGFHQILPEVEKPYLKDKYESSKGSFEHYFLFYEKSLKLLKENGFHGFIVPVTWLTIPSARSLRKFVLDNYSILEISWLSDFVFANAKVNTLISVMKKGPSKSVEVNIYDNLDFDVPPKEKRKYKQEYFIKSDYYISIFVKESDYAIIEKVRRGKLLYPEYAVPCSGYNPYESGKGEKPGGGHQNKDTVISKPYHSDIKISEEWKPEIIGRNLKRYHLNNTGTRWVKYGPWLAAPRDPNNFNGKRILVQEITGGEERRMVAAYYDGELYHSRDVIPIKIDSNKLSPYILLGIINSRLLTWYHLKANPKSQKKLFPKVLVSDLKKIPLPVDINQTKENPYYNDLILLVKQIINLENELNYAKIPSKKELIRRQIDATDKQIDKVVYELYGLTEKEIKIIKQN